MKINTLPSLLCGLALFFCPISKADNVDFPSRNVLSFEESTSPVVANKKSKLTLSDNHSKLGEMSLLWEWNGRGASICIPGEIPYLPENPNPKETSVSSFVFWVYSPEAIEGNLRFSFLKDGKECCHFEYGLGFTGWRGAWVAFDRDMEGKPELGMDKVVISAPKGVKNGQLYFDGIIPASFQDVRWHTPDWQAPYVNAQSDNMWMVLNRNWALQLDIPVEKELSASEIQDMTTVRERFVSLITEDKKPWPLEKLRKEYESIRDNAIFFIRYAETYLSVGIPDGAKQFSDNGQLLRKANDTMFQIALAWYCSKDEAERKELEDMYLSMTRHILDEGWAAGSGMGTLHHLGYSMRNFYTGPMIMREVLQHAGLLHDVQQAMEWFSGVGEVKIAPTQPGLDIDAFNTLMMGRVASIAIMEDSPYKYAYMKALSRWIDNGFRYTSGTLPCFKTDGTAHHHRKAYPAYATGGFTGATQAIWMFAGTGLAISEEGHEVLKKALLEMRFYCNKKSFPLAMSGRHPDGKGALIPEHYARLADAGSPDRTQAIDKDLASAYLRLNGSKGKWAKKFTEAGICAEAAPNGTHVYGYNCSIAHRRGEWLVTIAGHSRYLWSTEIYKGENHYGRYLTHGSMQILSAQEPDIDSFGSGYQVDGWDWCHFPGTTAAAIPMEQMKANVLNVDQYSGYEEMLFSDEWFAGGVSHKGVNGAFGMILHEHDKYNGSLRAHKSFFAIDNRIIALGSDLENALPNSELHTTLFQNTIAPVEENSKDVVTKPMTSLVDRLGNAYFVKNADVVLTRGLQHSFHEETDAPTEGYFEKAYIDHKNRNSYEYMAVVNAFQKEIERYSKASPYELVRCDKQVHQIVDNSGITACVVFEESDLEGTICHASPSLIMYSTEGKELTLSISNPDLALYEGPADEVYDNNGKRIERSVYGRKWIDNHCGETSVSVTLRGHWSITAPGSCDCELSYDGADTHLLIHTSEARTEELILTKVR